MTGTLLSVSPLVAALNDPSRTRIGNPARGTFYLSIAVDRAHDDNRLAAVLDGLEITYQVNFQRDKRGQPVRAFLAVYGLDDQRRLLEQVGGQLNEVRNRAFMNLVAARSPLSPEIVKKIETTLTYPGKSLEYIARRMNEERIMTGIGRGPWTASKLKRKLADTRAGQKAQPEVTKAT